MSRIRTVGGSITKTSKGSTTIEVLDGHFISSAAKQNNWDGGEKGNTYHEYKAPEKKQEIETLQEGVKEIELLTALDLGSKNDKSETFQDGMIFGKTYSFKVKSYTKETPKDKSVIKWMLKYHSLSENKWIIIPLPAKGETIKIKMNEKDLCGRFVYIRAYIKDPEKEGEFKLWKHNRFRWFDRGIISSEVDERKTKPYLANQKNTSLCGIAGIMYLLAKKNHIIYKKFILELHRVGYYEFDKYIVDISKKSVHLANMDPINNINYPSDYNGKMPYCDWISFSSVRDQENNIRDFDGEDDFSFDGATLPNEIKGLMKDILGFNNVVDNTNMIFNKGTLLWDGENSSSREIAKMSDLRRKGYEVIMLINTNMIETKEVKFKKNGINYVVKAKKAKISGITDTFEHWIVFEEVIGGTISWDEYDFKVFTWGEIKDIVINPEIFSTNFYGYVYGK